MPQYGFNKTYVDLAYIKSKGAIQQHADFDLKITAVNPAKDVADLSVTIKPKIAIPDSVVIHVFLYESYVDYKEKYNFPGNLAEKFIYNVVKRMPTGIDGTLIPALAVGQNHTVNVKLKRHATYDVADSMRVAVVLQRITTVIQQGNEVVKAKEALAAVDTKGSPFLNNMIIVGNSRKLYRKQYKSIGFRNIKENVYSFNVPFDNSTVELFTLSGKKIKSLKLSDKSKGESVQFKTPTSNGIYLLKIRDNSNQVINLKILNY